MYLSEFKNQYGKKLRCPSTQVNTFYNTDVRSFRKRVMSPLLRPRKLSTAPSYCDKVVLCTPQM